MGHLRRDCWHWNKEQNKGKYEKNNSEKNTTAAVIDEDVVVLSIEEQKCKHVANNDVEWVFDPAAPPPTILSLRRGCLPRTRQETLVQCRWVIYSKLWELVMCALKPMLVAL